MSDVSEATLVASKSVAVCQIENGLALLDTNRNVYFSLNETGAVVWKALAEPSSIGDVCIAIAKHFDTTELACRADVEQLVSKLVASNLAVIADAKTS